MAHVESFWFLFKRSIRSTHIHVSPKYMNRHLDEFTFRSNHREMENATFDLVVGAIPTPFLRRTPPAPQTRQPARRAVRRLSSSRPMQPPVGWLIADGDDLKALTPNMGSINDERSLQVSGVIQIPTSCVLRVTRLEEPST